MGVWSAKNSTHWVTWLASSSRADSLNEPSDRGWVKAALRRTGTVTVSGMQGRVEQSTHLIVCSGTRSI
jgi:hypothetical protein